MAANICPICSGEIMTYKRFLKEAEPSKVAVCQCCGARLRRGRGGSLKIGALLACLAGLAGLLFSLSAKALMPYWGSGATILVLSAIALLVTRHLGWRLTGWEAIVDPSLTSTLPPAGRKTFGS